MISSDGDSLTLDMSLGAICSEGSNLRLICHFHSHITPHQMWGRDKPTKSPYGKFSSQTQLCRLCSMEYSFVLFAEYHRQRWDSFICEQL